MVHSRISPSVSGRNKSLPDVQYFLSLQGEAPTRMLFDILDTLTGEDTVTLLVASVTRLEIQVLTDITEG